MPGTLKGREVECLELRQLERQAGVRVRGQITPGPQDQSEPCPQDTGETWKGFKQEDTISFVFHKTPSKCQVAVR